MLWVIDEKSNHSVAVFLAKGYGYHTAFFRLGLSSRLERTFIKTWFKTLKARVDCSLTSIVLYNHIIRQGEYEYRLYSPILADLRYKRDLQTLVNRR